jgi:hypothetical protein
MELFEAGNEDQWSYIRNRINEVDYYLVIVAERYGSVGPDGLSYTEMEYRYAVENNVPVAALLLDSAQRRQWPSAKVDYENRDKLEAFRQLCQQKMVSYWSDVGTLTTKCQLALNGLVRRFPRTGWVSADQAVSPHVVSELARLSEENAKLRAEVAKYGESDRATKETERVVAILREPLVEDIKRLAEKFGGGYLELLNNPVMAEILGGATIFNLMVGTIGYFLDGTEQDNLADQISNYLLKQDQRAQDSVDEKLVDFCVNVLLLRMKIRGLLETYEVQKSDRSVAQKVRLSDLARRGFEFAFSQFVDR